MITTVCIWYCLPGCAVRYGTDGTLRYDSLYNDAYGSYFGEVLFHVGALCYGLAAGVVPLPSTVIISTMMPAPLVVVALIEYMPACAMALFFRYVSVPRMEQRSVAKRPGYTKLVERVPSPLLPWPPIAQQQRNPRPGSASAADDDDDDDDAGVDAAGAGARQHQD